jgi:acetyltransferase-like isoleucine patch superfamily enzyme
MGKIVRKIFNFFLNLRFSRKCIVGKNSVFLKEAEVINNFGNKSRIIVGNDSYVRGQLLTFGHGGSIKIGDYCYLGRDSYVWSGGKISIGDRVLISHNCSIFDNDTHPLDAEERHKQFKQIIKVGQPKKINLNDEEVIIDDDALIGTGVIILKGSHIGKGAIIGAGSVVTGNIDPYTIVAGNPAKLIRQIS